MNTWRQRIEFCAHACPPHCAYPIGNDPPLAEIGRRLGRRALAEVAFGAEPDTVLAWRRKLMAQKFDGSKYRLCPGTPNLEVMIVQMAKENFWLGVGPDCGRALANLGYTVSDETIGNVLTRHGIAPAPKRSRTTTWKEFYSNAYGGVGRHRFPHSGSAHPA